MIFTMVLTITFDLCGLRLHFYVTYVRLIRYYNLGETGLISVELGVIKLRYQSVISTTPPALGTVLHSLLYNYRVLSY